MRETGGAASPAVPTPAEYDVLKEQAKAIAESGLAPKSVNTPEKVLVIALKGREMGIPPLQALSHIHIVEGKPTISSELMVALVQRAGHKLRMIETGAEQCVVEGVRRDDPDYPQRVTFSLDDARKAEVLGKSNWKHYPAAMLRARAISALCRFAFADVLMGASYTPEELGLESGKWIVDDDDPEDQAEHEELMIRIAQSFDRIPEDYPRRPDETEVIRTANESVERARRVLTRLNDILHEAALTENSNGEERQEKPERDEVAP